MFSDTNQTHMEDVLDRLDYVHGPWHLDPTIIAVVGRRAEDISGDVEQAIRDYGGELVQLLANGDQHGVA